MMSFTRGNYFIIFHLLILAFNVIVSSSTSANSIFPSRCGLLTGWTLYITNNVESDIVVHIKSTDHDLGNHTIHFNDVYSWTFCQKIIGTHFTGDFYWGSKHQSLALIDRELIFKCRQKIFGDDDCYWLVRPDGFYVSASNKPFPYGWEKMKSWP